MIFSKMRGVSCLVRFRIHKLEKQSNTWRKSFTKKNKTKTKARRKREKLNLTFIRLRAGETVMWFIFTHKGINSLMHDADSGLKHHNSLTGHAAILGLYPKEKEGTRRPQLLISLLILLSIICIFHSCLPPSQDLSAYSMLHSVVWERELPESKIQTSFQALQDPPGSDPCLPTSPTSNRIPHVSASPIFDSSYKTTVLQPQRLCFSWSAFRQFPPLVLLQSSLAPHPCISSVLPQRAFGCTVLSSQAIPAVHSIANSTLWTYFLIVSLIRKEGTWRQGPSQYCSLLYPQHLKLPEWRNENEWINDSPVACLLAVYSGLEIKISLSRKSTLNWF